MSADVEGVRLLTLNRPERRNALSPELIAAMEAALVAASGHDDIGAVVITGAGSAFCAGLDMDAYFAPGADRTVASRVLRSIAAFPKPLIAAVNGACVTGGLELALNCDFIVAGESATFRDTHLVVGAFPGGGMIARLPQAIGLRNAKMVSFLGEPLPAREAAALGLVSRIASDDALIDTAVDMARVISQRDPALVRSIKDAYDTSARLAVGGALDVEFAANTRRRWATAQAGITPPSTDAS